MTAGAALLTVLGAVALLELVVEPVFRKNNPIDPALVGVPLMTRIDAAARAFSSYPIALLAFAAVGLVVAARGRDDGRGSSVLTLASIISVICIAVGVLVVVRTIGNRDPKVFPSIAWDRTQGISSALASVLVGVVAWMTALRFWTRDRREASLAASSPFRAPSVATIRNASAFVGAAVVGLAMNIGAEYAAARNPTPFGLKTDLIAEPALLAVGVLLGAAILAQLARGDRNAPVGRAFFTVVAGVALFLGAYAFADALFIDRSAPYNPPGLVRHQFAAFGAGAVVLALAVLSLVVNGYRELPEGSEAVDADDAEDVAAGTPAV